MSDYQSNLTCPDLRPNFKHLNWRPMGHSFGHDVASDFSDYPPDSQLGYYQGCGLWTRDEAAILYNTAALAGGRWIDIGAHTGWTSAHIGEATGEEPMCIDPMFRVNGFYNRWMENTGFRWGGAFCGTSREFFSEMYSSERWIYREYTGVCIDGDHEPGMPLEDARNSLNVLTDTAVIAFHDGTGRPVREAVEYLLNNGFKARCYLTPHVVFVCWSGDFVPVDHVPDPFIVAQNLPGRWPDFDMGRMS